MQILTSHLKAVLLAASKKDIRYYLNGVHVTKHHLVGTDGHRMHIVCHGGDWPHDPVTIPRDACELAVKGKTTTLELTPTAVGAISYPPVKGRYPDYTHVMLSSNGLAQGVSDDVQMTRLRWEYLRDAEAAVKLVTGKAHFALAEIKGYWVWSNPQIQVGVMPQRLSGSIDGKAWQSYSLEALSC